MSITYNCVVPIFANLAPGYLLGVRGDTAQVDLIDNLRQGTVPYVAYRTHIVALPEERLFRVLRIILKGEGVVTGGHVVFTWDGNRTETYLATGASFDVTQDILIRQNCLGTKTGRQCDVLFTLSGTNLVIREAIFDIVEVE